MKKLVAAIVVTLFLLSVLGVAFPFGPNVTSYPAVAGSTTSIRFAVIGDYGLAGTNELDVANLVIGWSPDFVITVGDNNCPSGAASTIDQNIGQYYHNFICPYTGGYGAGADTNRFFPTIGNHDWGTPGAAPYLAYFTLPGNERYYDFVWGPVHFFALDSDFNEPDGTSSTSTQANCTQDWLPRQSLGSWCTSTTRPTHPADTTAQALGCSGPSNSGVLQLCCQDTIMTTNAS